MRIRRKPGVEEKLLAQTQYVIDPNRLQQTWSHFFTNDHPVHAELGTGKGRFITTLAQRNPDVNYVGVERVPEVLWQCVKKAVDLNLRNVAFLWMDVQGLPSLAHKGKWERIYLNFSDPWPKRRHAKRRLTHPSFLSIYEQLLVPGGEIFLKTDNAGFFEYSLNQVADRDYRLRAITLNLHESEWREDNIMTEYEEKFSKKGQPIYRFEARLRT